MNIFTDITDFKYIAAVAVPVDIVLDFEEAVNFPIEFLNSLNLFGLHPHKIMLSCYFIK